ncbi:MAG: class I adenylate-forming enzyme family protein [Collinsella sp.]|nr:class I adenylate-forming enzyme family protein [Collinsella sp.]
MAMIRGSSCWSSSLQRDMGACEIGGIDFYTFEQMPETIYDILAGTADATPDSVAIVDDDGARYTFADLAFYADHMAAYLSERYGVLEGDRVGLLLDASIEFCATYFACSKIGAVVVPFSTKYREREIGPLLSHSELKVLLLDSRYVDRVGSAISIAPVIELCDRSGEPGGFGFPAALDAVPSPRAAGGLSSDAVMMYTSGTTSSSKAVRLSNLNVIHAAMVYQRLMGTTATDRTVIPVPIYHVTGLIALLTQFVLAGARVYLHRRFDAHRLLDCVRDEDITYLHASPTAFEKVLAFKREFPTLPSMRVILSGSSYEPVNKMRAFHEWLPHCAFQVVYGLTETASPALLFPFDSPTSIYAGATGKPVPGVDARIIDDEGFDVETGRVGEVLLRGTCITPGYFRCDRMAVDEDGWLATGDMGYADRHGMIWVVDRKKDMINRGGEKVWCSCLEEAIASIDGVGEACVTGIPDDLYGEVPAAAVVLEPGSTLTAESIIASMRDRVAGFEVPERVLLVDHIPQTSGDKPDRAAVRAMVVEHDKESNR